MSKQVIVSDSTYELIMKVYSMFKDVFGSIDDFLKASVQEFYYRNSDVVLNENNEDEIDEIIFKLANN